MARHLARLLGAFIVAAVLLATLTTYRIVDQGGRDEARRADAIVVMGAAQYDGRPSPVLEARLEHAVALYRAGIAPLLVVTGGKATGDRTTEADAARAWAIDHGVPAEAILADDRGRTTLESIESVAVLFEARGITSAVFVSDPSHLLRVLRIATDQGVRAWGSGTRTSPVEGDRATRIGAIVHELGALAVYFSGAGHLIREESGNRTP